jgi:hypothetical protein
MVVELSSYRAMQIERGKNQAGSVQRFSCRRNCGPQSTAAAFRAVAYAEWAGWICKERNARYTRTFNAG